MPSVLASRVPHRQIEVRASYSFIAIASQVEPSRRSGGDVRRVAGNVLDPLVPAGDTASLGVLAHHVVGLPASYVHEVVN